MMLSEAAEAIINHCFSIKDGTIVTIAPLIGEKYTIGDVHFKFTEKLLAEVATSERVKIVSRYGDSVNITGLVNK